MQALKSMNYLVVGLIIILQIAPNIYAEQTTRASIQNAERPTFKIRDAEIRDALTAISAGNLPSNDNRLVELIIANVRDVASKAAQPSAGIEAVARLAQEAVSQVTAAYTTVIFRSTSVKDAESLFTRFEDTVNKIVEFAKSGNFIPRYHPADLEKRAMYE